MKKVCAIVVTYNRKAKLEECLDALLAQKYEGLEIVLVDNASTDGTGELVAQKYRRELRAGKIVYEKLAENVGGAGGFNAGMKRAAEEGAELMWLMDDDCVPREDALRKLMEADKELEGRYGFLVSKAVWVDGAIAKMNVPKVGIFKKVEDFQSGLVKVEMATFVSFLVPTEVVGEVGLPIKEFFIWSDDLEYSYRISRKRPGYLANGSVVMHKSESNVGSDIASDEKKNLWKYKYAYRNERYLFGKKAGLAGKIYLKLKILKHKLKLKRTDLSDKEERLALIDEALKEGASFAPEVEYLGGGK